MKTKKALAVILALAMIITLMPTMAFATTSNTVSGVQTIAKSGEFDTTLELEIKNDPKNWEKVDGQVTEEVTLTLDNAKWAYKEEADGETKTSAKLTKEAVETATKKAIVAKVTTSDADVPATVEYCSPTSVILKFDPTSVKKGNVIQLTLNLKATNTTGDVKVDLGSLSGDITGGSYTVATVVAKATVANVPDYNTEDLELVTIRNTEQAASDIVIRESSAGVVKGEQVFTLTLPKEVEWNEKMLTPETPDPNNPYKQISGSLLGTDTPTVEYAIDSEGNINKRVLKITFTPGTATGARRTLTISPLVDTTKNAKEGDLTVTVRNIKGDISDASNLVIAKIGQTDVSVYVDEEDYSEGEIPAFYSGLTPDLADDDNLAIITVKEKKAGDLTKGKYIDFTFDSEVQLAGNVQVSINGTKGTSGLGSDAEANKEKNRSSFGWKVVDTLNGSDANEIKFYIPITVDAGFDGDVKCVVSGSAAGIDEDVTVTVAKVKPVIKLDAEVSEVRTGVQKQAIKNITLTETEAGALDDDSKEVTVELPFALSKDPTVAVTAGDLEIKDVKVEKVENEKKKITFKIDGSSVKEASTITISDLEITLNRNPAEGGYDIKAYGSALINNGDYNDKAFADEYKAVDAIKIVTPADPSLIQNKINAQFVISQASYTNNGTSVAMDAAPYIDSNSRTMVPIRYVANACGVSDNNIVWNGATQTATMSGANTVVTIKVGASTITTSTGTITMDTVAVNRDGRIYVPLRFIANAFGAEVAWDQAAQTASIMK